MQAYKPSKPYLICSFENKSKSVVVPTGLLQQQEIHEYDSSLRKAPARWPRHEQVLLH